MVLPLVRLRDNVALDLNAYEIRLSNHVIASGALDEVAYVSPGGPITPRDMLYGYAPYIAGGNVFMTHKTGFTARTLCLELERAGFVGGEVFNFVCDVHMPVNTGRYS